jgi:hypothetical protein
MNTDNLYELDTARAKTPPERLRIVADLMEAQERGEDVYRFHGEILAVCADCVRPQHALSNARYVTKRRPVLVIPALELFEGPMIEVPEHGRRYFVPSAYYENGYSKIEWSADSIDADCLKHGLCFRTPEAAARIGLHIRNALSNFVASAKAVRP